MKHVSVNICEDTVDLVVLEDGQHKILRLTWDEVAELVDARGIPVSATSALHTLAELEHRGGISHVARTRMEALQEPWGCPCASCQRGRRPGGSG